MPIFDATQAARRFAQMETEDAGRPLVDRMSMLPIGQYEDGSLTLAWPGMLKDMYESAARSAVAQEGPPTYDDGGRYLSGSYMNALDPLNAASIAPMAGVAGRVSGAIPRGALGSGGSDMLTKAAVNAATPDDDFAFQTLVKAFGGDETKARSFLAAKNAPTGNGVRPRDNEIFSWPVRAATRIGDKYYVAQTHGMAVDNGLARLGFSRDALLDDPRVDALLNSSEDGFMINGRFLTRSEAAKAVGSPGEYIGSEHGFDLDNLEKSARSWWKLPIGRGVRDDDWVDVSETLFANPSTSSFPSLLMSGEDDQQDMSTSDIARLYETYMRAQQ